MKEQLKHAFSSLRNLAFVSYVDATYSYVGRVNGKVYCIKYNLKRFALQLSPTLCPQRRKLFYYYFKVPDSRHVLFCFVKQ